jgi:hypothetical protein
VSNKKQKEVYTLSELADSGLLPWRNKATIRKYVNAYEEIFLPKMRGSGSRDKRYVIAHKNVLNFLDKFDKGELKDFKKVRAGDGRLTEKFVSIVSVGHLDKAKKLRDALESKGVRVDLLSRDSKRDFMGTLGKTTKTHGAVIIVSTIKDGNFVIGNEKINSSDIKRIPDAVGISGKMILFWTDSEPSKKIREALEGKGVISFSVIKDEGKNTFLNILAWTEGHGGWAKISNIQKRKSLNYRTGTRRKVDNDSVKKS